MSNQIVNIDLVKQLNSAIVYRLIDQQGPISRVRIAELINLAPASITKITRQLLERNLIIEVAQQNSTGGRPATSIIVNTKPFHTIAVLLGRNAATIELYDLSAKSLAEKTYHLPERDQDKLESALLSAINDFIDQYRKKIRKLIAISVILPGLIDPRNGIVKYMPHIAVNEWKLTQALYRRFDIPSFIGHDIRCLALAEHYFGSTHDCDDSILVRVHRGTGAGVIINRNILDTRNHNIAEIGHIQVDPLGERCHCGNFGCLENITANSAIEKQALTLLRQGYKTKLTQQNCTIENICQAANQDDPLAVEIIQYTGRYLGKGIAIAINLFNPEKVVIAGEITQAEKILLPAVQEAINHQTLKEFRQHLSLSISTLSQRPAIGAFALVKRAMYSGELLKYLLGYTKTTIGLTPPR